MTIMEYETIMEYDYNGYNSRNGRNSAITAITAITAISAISAVRVSMQDAGGSACGIGG